MDRKYFLKIMAAGGASFLGLNPTAFAAALNSPSKDGDDNPPPRKVGPVQPWGRLRFRAERGDDDDWNVDPNGDLNLIEHIVERTSVNLSRDWFVADVAKLDDMVGFPFLFMHAELAPELTETETSNLREYMLRGGFLFAEDCVNGKHRTRGRRDYGDIFFRRMVDVLPRIVPEAKFERLPDDHPVFSSVYLVKGGMPHMQGIPHGLHGLTLNGRVLALLSPSDLHCGWANGDSWFYPGATHLACAMGTNIYTFAMTQDDELARPPLPHPT
jgi:Domain of unknown function (DUF4159)